MKLNKAQTEALAENGTLPEDVVFAGGKFYTKKEWQEKGKAAFEKTVTSATPTTSTDNTGAGATASTTNS